MIGSLDITPDRRVLRPMRYAIVPLVLAAAARPSVAQMSDGVGRTRPTATAHRTAAPPVIDGRLDDEAWTTAPAITGFVQHEPLEGAPATERTVVRVVFGGDALYVAAWLYDSDASAIVVGETRRDASLDDTDAFLMVLDTYKDGQNGFVFGTNPSGIEYDGQVTHEGGGGFGGGGRQQVGSGGGFNLNWDGSWTVATSTDAQGWYAEFRIPFATLRYASAGSQDWGVNFARHLRRRNEQAFWSRVGREFDLYRVSEAGVLTGLEPPARLGLTVTPYVLGSTARDYTVEEEWKRDAELGGEAKIGLTPSLALDLTYNTDFAQVEVDEQQINITRFNLFFPEKRPFFLENAGTFAVGTPQEVELFFSRRIGLSDEGAPIPIVGGGRLTGKVGGLTVGLLDLQTERLDTAAEPPTNYGVVRVLRELPSRSRIGVIGASRIATDRGGDYNYTIGVDGRLGVGDALLFEGYAAKTETPGLTGRDHSLALTGHYTTRDWEAELAYREVGGDFNPEVGFLQRTDYRFVEGFVLRHVRLPHLAWLREFRPHVSYQGFFNFDGFYETGMVHFDNHTEFANGAFISTAVNLTREGLEEPFEIVPGIVVPPGGYDNVEGVLRFNTNTSAALSASGEATVGGFLSGSRRGMGGSVQARGGATLLASIDLTYDHVDLPEGRFDAVVTGLRAAYSFTPRIYLQALIQFNNQAETWTGNIRFGWLATAGTGLFLVYNEGRGTGDLSGPLQRSVTLKYTRQFGFAF